MPIYEYRCLKCGNKMELIKSLSHSDECPLCDSCGSVTYKSISRFAHPRCNDALDCLPPEVREVPTVKKDSGHAFIRADGGEVILKGNVFMNGNSAVSLGGGASLEMDGNVFHNMKNIVSIDD